MRERSLHLSAACTVLTGAGSLLPCACAPQAAACPRPQDLAASVRSEHPGVSVDAHFLYGLDCSGRETAGGRLVREFAVVAVRAPDRGRLSAAVRRIVAKLPAGAEAVVQGGWLE